jgi:hypothetical protein
MRVHVGDGWGGAVTRLRSIVFDCERPAALARFWADALGYEVRPYSREDLEQLASQGIDDPEDDPTVVIDPPSGEAPTVWFNRVPERKSGKNRMHIDVDVESEKEIERLVARGARVLRALGGEPGSRWAILADPEGNEFCVFPRGR